MRRFFPLWMILGVAIALLSGVWLAKSSGVRNAMSAAPDQNVHSLLRSVQSAWAVGGRTVPDPGVHSLLRHPIEFAKSRFTGGIGVILTLDPQTGLPMLQAIGAGSPADRAGLKPGDIIVKIDGRSSTGVALTQIVEQIRGVTAVNVTLTIKHNGSTQPSDCVVRRASWNALGGLAYRLPPSYQTFTMSQGVNGGMPVWSIIQTNLPGIILNDRSKGILHPSKP